MKVRVTLVKHWSEQFTYEVDGVNSLETAKKCAQRCMNKEFQPNTYLFRRVPHPPYTEVSSMEVLEC